MSAAEKKQPAKKRARRVGDLVRLLQSQPQDFARGIVRITGEGPSDGYWARQVQPEGPVFFIRGDEPMELVTARMGDDLPEVACDADPLRGPA